MKKLLTILAVLVITASLCLTGCTTDVGDETKAPETVSITNTETALTPGTHTLTAAVLPEKASQAVTWSLIGSPAGVSIDADKLTVAETAKDGLEFKVKAAAQTDPTVSDTKTFTVNNPAPDAIEISTEEELRNIVLTGNYKLVNDIALTQEWTPLGEAESEDDGIAGVGLTGTLDGNGYKITNFNTAEGGYNKGMFYKIEETGVVKNLGIESGKGADEGLRGQAWCGVIAGSNRGLISNCYTDVKVTMKGVPGGALAGSNQPSGIIENCYAIGPVITGGGAHGAAFVNANNGTISHSYVLNTSVNSAIGWNKTQNENIQKSENWMKTAQNYIEEGWNEDIWCLVDGYYPMLRHEGFEPPVALPVLNITNTEEFLDYNVVEQRTLQITYNIANVTDTTVSIALEAPVEGVSISAEGLVTLSENVADGAKFTVVVTSLESASTVAKKTFTVNNAKLDEVVEISTFEQLKALSTSTNPADMAKNYRLVNDIDADAGWFNNAIAPCTGADANEIAYAATPFTGTFDGNGYSILGFKGGDGKRWMGLFGEIGVGGVVKNLTITLGGKDRYVGVASAAIAAVNRGTIENVMLAGPGHVMGAENQWVATMVFNNLGTMKNCINLVKLSNDGSPLAKAGIAHNNSGTIENCVFDSELTGIATALGSASDLDAACALTTAQMKSSATYEGWDTEIWNITEGEYPTLKNGCSVK